ncbi:MAG: hypothetical protein U0326_18595 [Polyangiales bacterium]
MSEAAKKAAAHATGCARRSVSATAATVRHAAVISLKLDPA